ncbi:YihY/virulence factor BrkB family protein [Aestuariimicrobium soli]|uniref:YihY/virulence factor BrkB family protein n=1 Tax=Aestuariimicrobium soli TaxID=2035834 RepID=UPI003EC0012F
MPRPLRDRLAQQARQSSVLAPLAQAAKVPWRTIQAALRYRVMGLAAESAFFAVLSLPPLLFGLAGSVGFVAQRYSVQSVAEFKTRIVEVATPFLTQSAIDQVLVPTLDEVLSAGRVDVISIGFLLALWSGSRAMSVFVDTVSIMYGHAGKRGIIHARALSFGIYLASLLLAAVMLPLVLAGPSLVTRLLPEPLTWIARAYWPTVLIGSTLLLTTLYWWAVPLRRRWRADVPGAVLTLGLWLAGSWVLRFVLDESLGGSSLYGPLSAPIALLLWLYLTSLAVLLGAAFNASLESVWPHVSGISDRQAEQIHEAVVDGTDD